VYSQFCTTKTLLILFCVTTQTKEYLYQIHEQYNWYLIAKYASKIEKETSFEAILISSLM